MRILQGWYESVSELGINLSNDLYVTKRLSNPRVVSSTLNLGIKMTQISYQAFWLIIVSRADTGCNMQKSMNYSLCTEFKYFKILSILMANKFFDLT